MKISANKPDPEPIPDLAGLAGLGKMFNEINGVQIPDWAKNRRKITEQNQWVTPDPADPLLYK